jgi:hypothetical protein|nr:MAG TPA: protein of unknown function (DUF4911) [Caudoviricetes sp.]
MEEKNNAYIKYLLEFYDGQAQGLRPKDVRPNSFAEITGSDEPSYLDDLVDVIEKLKYLG